MLNPNLTSILRRNEGVYSQLVYPPHFLLLHKPFRHPILQPYLRRNRLIIILPRREAEPPSLLHSTPSVHLVPADPAQRRFAQEEAASRRAVAHDEDGRSLY